MARRGRIENPQGRMPLAGHLREFKRRFLIAGIAFGLCAIGGFFLAAPVLQLLSAPLDDLRAQGLAVDLNITNVTQAFDVQMRIAFMLGIILSSPIWLWQLLAFIVPGLRSVERRYVFGFVGAAVPLFIGGCLTGWYVLPRIISLFVGFTPAGFSAYLGAQDYWDFSFKLVFAVGVAYVSKWYPKEKQGTALGIFGAGNVGAAVTKFLAPFVLVAYGWETVAQVWAVALVAVVGVAAIVLVPELTQVGQPTAVAAESPIMATYRRAVGLIDDGKRAEAVALLSGVHGNPGVPAEAVLQLAVLEIEMERLQAWDGKYPQLLFSGDSGDVPLLFNLDRLSQE